MRAAPVSLAADDSPAGRPSTLLQQLGVMCLEPSDDVRFQALGQRAHRLRVGVGSESGLIVPGSISFLPKRIEFRHQLAIRADSMFQAQDDTEMVRVTRRLIAGSRQSCHRALQSGIVGNGQTAVITQTLCLAISQVPVGYAQQVRNLLAAALSHWALSQSFKLIFSPH